MKNFTKVLSALALVMGISAASYAQIDITTNVVNSPANGASIQTVLPTPLDIRFTNNGPNMIPGGSGVEVEVFVDGSLSGSVTGFSAPDAGVAVGADIGFNGLEYRFNIPANSGTIRVCYNVKMDMNSDPVPGNDTAMCVYYNVETGTTVDLSMANLAIVAPPTSAGGTIGSNGETITEMSVEITNEGDFTYPAGFQLPYSLEVQGATPNSIVGILANPLAPNATTMRTINQFTAIPALPDGGTFTMCATAMISNDNDATNNRTCTDYFSLVGIDEVESGEALTTVNFDANNDVLTVFLSQYINGQLDLTVTNISGQTIKGTSINANGQQTEEIDLSGVANGVYVLTARTADGQVEAQKFVIR